MGTLLRIFVPVGLAVIVAVRLWMAKSHRLNSFNLQQSTAMKILNPRSNFIMCDVLDLVEYLACSALVSGVTVSLVKNLVGAPRPDFFDRCYPSVSDNYTQYDYGKIQAKIENLSVFESDWRSSCEFMDEPGRNKIVYGGLKSFPSGHSNNANGGALFVALYIWSKLKAFSKCNRVNFLPFLAGVPVVLFGVWVGITRIQDYRHHPVDVLAGTVLGWVVTLVVRPIFYPNLCGEMAHLSWSQVEWLRRK